ncbi:endothelin-3 [Cynoglossus semilaevis]|uniref:endothelin-3 n=1 Tax=Cynoglossus semilaevis TaxID=244447 RepID=UPI000497A3AE|nr:endothelin-3-like [Cynoglossus semilaevis]
MDLWLLCGVLIFLHMSEVCSISGTGLSVEKGPLVQLAHRAQHRHKRCSCENQKDGECIFFCHIGIVWINSPSHVVPYGSGSVRQKRETERCLCSNSQDQRCVRFCSTDRRRKLSSAEKQHRYKDALWERGVAKHPEGGADL